MTAVDAEFDSAKMYKQMSSGASSSTSTASGSSTSTGEVVIHQRNPTNPYKRMKVTMINRNFLDNDDEEPKPQDKASEMMEYIAMVVISLICYCVYYTFWL